MGKTGLVERDPESRHKDCLKLEERMKFGARVHLGMEKLIEWEPLGNRCQNSIITTSSAKVLILLM